jgi:hypothetical protein
LAVEIGLQGRRDRHLRYLPLRLVEIIVRSLRHGAARAIEPNPAAGPGVHVLASAHQRLFALYQA